MSRPVFDLANLEDDASLRRLLRENSIPGKIGLSFEREPFYFHARTVEGPFSQTIVARNSKTGQLLGFGDRSVRELFVNGVVQPVGYLSQLRADLTHPWGLSLARVLAQGFAYVRLLHADARAPFYLMSVVSDNTRAHRMLTSSLQGMPRLTEYGRFRTYVIALAGRKRELPLPRGFRLSNATRESIGAVADCLQRNGERYQFAPYWTAQTLFQPDSAPGLNAESFFLAGSGNRVLGCLARWDQSKFKQTVVRGYSPSLRRWRRLINLAGSVIGWPPLPKIDSPIRHCFASHLAIDHDDPIVFAALLRAVYNDAVQHGFSYVMLGLPEAHRFCEVVESYRHILYPVHLYLAGWEDSFETIAKIDRRPPGVEIATL